MPIPATIKTRTDKRGIEHVMWECPNCHKPLGELVGDRLIVVVSKGWHWSLRLVAGMETSCPRCHTQSTIGDYAMLGAIEYRSTVAQ